MIAEKSDLFVAFTRTEGNADFSSSSGAFETSYGHGAGPKIVFLARISPESGNILAATFIGCKLSNGNAKYVAT